MTSKIRSEALESFVKCFNICYPEWEVDGDETEELAKEYVEYSYTTSYWAKCGPRRNGRVYFAINKSWYHDATPAERIGLLIHELAHVHHTDHSPEFWEQVVDNYHSMAANSDAVEDVILGNPSWQEVKEFIVNDPYTGQVDNRREIVYERRLDLAEGLDYPKDEIEPFEEMTIKYQRARGRNKKRVSLSRLEFTEKNIDDVIAYFHTRPREYLSKYKTRHIIQPLPARKEEGEYEILECHEMATLAKLAGLRYITVEFVNDEGVDSGARTKGSGD